MQFHINSHPPKKLTWHWKIAMFNRKYMFKWWFSIVVSVFGGYMFNCRPSICWYLCCQYFHGHRWVMKRFAGPISSRSQQGVGDVTWHCQWIERSHPHTPGRYQKKTLGISLKLWVFAEVWGTGPQFYVGKIIDECSWHFFWVNQGQTPRFRNYSNADSCFSFVC